MAEPAGDTAEVLAPARDARLHELGSTEADGACMAASAKLQVLMVAKGASVRAFHVGAGAVVPRAGAVRLPYLGGPPGPPGSLGDVWAMAWLGLPDGDADVLCLAGTAGLRLYEVRLAPAFRAVADDEKLAHVAASPLRWRLWHSGTLPGASDGAADQRLHVCALPGGTGGACFRLCVAGGAGGIGLMDYEHFGSAKRQLEAPPPKVTALECGAVRSVALAPGPFVLYADAQGALRAWWPQSQAAHEVRVQTEGTSAPVDDAALSRVVEVAWIFPRRVFWALLEDGRRDVYSLDGGSAAPGPLCVALEATYPPLGAPEKEKLFPGASAFALSGGSEERWAVAATAGTPSRSARAVAVRVTLARDGSLECSSLLELVNVGVVRLRGTAILPGGLALAIQGRGTHAAAPAPLGRALAALCGLKPGVNAVGLLALTEEGVNLACLRTAISLPPATSAATVAPKRSMGKPVRTPVAGRSRDKQVAKENAGGSTGNQGPPEAAASPKPGSLMAQVTELRDRLTQTEADLVLLRTDFVTFTTEVASGMAELATALRTNSRST